MTKPLRGDNGRTYCPLSTGSVGFRPRQIIFRHLIPNDADPDNSRYRDIFMPRRYHDSNSFLDLVRQIANHGYSSPRRDPPETQILDIPVWKKSVIMFQLPRGPKYWFRDPAIVLETEADHCGNDLYGRLTYVDRQGNPHRHHIPNCQLIYFYADLREGSEGRPHLQHFNFDVHPLPRSRLIYIDPDIRHPGIGGQNPEEEGP